MTVSVQGPAQHDVGRATWGGGDEDLSGILVDAWNAIGTPLVVVDDAFDLVFANPAARASVDRLDTEGGAALRTLVPGTRTDAGSEVAHDRRPLVRALAGETVSSEEFVVPAGTDGRVRRYVVSAHPLPARRGRRFALLSWTDVTGRWLREVERRGTVERLTRLIDGADEHAILMLDVEGRVLTWSRSAERLVGYDEDAVLGRHYSIFFTAEDRAAGTPEALLCEAAARGRVATGGERLRSDGSRFWSRGVLTALADGHGRVEGYVKVTQDVTEEHDAKRRIVELNGQLEVANHRLEHVNAELVRANVGLEENIAARTSALVHRTSELAEANSELEAFSYSVSHDLRAPLRTIAGFADLLAEDHAQDLDDDGLRYLRRIRDAAGEMGHLIDGLLRLARLQRLPLLDETVDMTALARAGWDDAGADARYELCLHDLPPARGDRQLLQQVWRNLLSNAVKFSARADAPTVEVTGRATGEHVTYLVRDNGIGFDPATAGELFQPFQRLHPARDFAGSGIGLAIVRRVVHRHGGDVSAQGRPGHGATFSFTLARG